jgi:SAM-dependent methyltransferase
LRDNRLQNQRLNNLSDSIKQYDARAQEYASKYEALTFEQVHGELLDILPPSGGFILDVGCGSGRDAAWFASHGYQVVAIEPAKKLLELARQVHSQPEIVWLQDKLPGLEQTIALGRSFDFALVSAVWMHVHPSNRQRAFRKLVSLLKPGGSLVITFRNGGFDDGREDYPTSVDELQLLCMQQGIAIKRIHRSEDRLQRPGVEWQTVIMQLPDDGTEAFPLLRHITLVDKKSSTYKVALLRVLVRIADSATGMVTTTGDDEVSIPLGLVALYWNRMYKPLLDAGIPQAPLNAGGKGLGFVKEAYRSLTATSPYDLRIGGTFTGTDAHLLRQALLDTRNVISEMPAHYITYPNSDNQIFKATRSTAAGIPRMDKLRLTSDYLSAFGELRVPANIWSALSRFASWIEPALVSEWIRLMQSYCEGRPNPPTYDQLMRLLVWIDPNRDTDLVRKIAADQLKQNNPIYCVWTGKRLQLDNLDIDHCFPFAVWPCGDLWNLMTVHRDVNQKQKRDRLITAPALENSKRRIFEWWNQGYTGNEVFRDRYVGEAFATLPITADCDAGQLESIFDGMSLKRMILKRDLQITDWTPKE